MSAKISFPSALVLAALSLSMARAQAPPSTPYSPSTASPPALGLDATAPLPPPGGPGYPNGGPARLSDWINYKRPCSCCEPVGGDGPVQTELYLRGGISIIIDGGVLADTLHSGWIIEGGARSLFFNPDMTAAWAVSYGISNVWNQGKNPNIKVPLSVLVPTPPTPDNPNGGAAPVNFGVDVPGVTIRSFNRTFVNLGVGREWFLFVPSACEGLGWRFGADLGGRWGSANLDLHELRHRTDVIGGVWFALHSDVEIPWGCWNVIAGFRAEWAYTWSDILQRQNKSDLMDVNLLVNLGVRF
ncbi:MAG: hypothetical protein L0Z62_48135 [Gemmataceae bacterium]|nr:hypothetical protein [Gemmataceae bacterium]